MTTTIAAGTTTTPETRSATGIENAIARDTAITDEDVITGVANGRETAIGREV